MSRIIDVDLEILSDRYSRLSVQSNRLWAASAFLLLAIVSSDFSAEGTGQVFGITVTSGRFYWVATIIALFTNFAYCSSHIVNLNAGRFYREFVKCKGLGQKEICTTTSGRKYTGEDLAHFLYESNYNRSYPIEMALSAKIFGPAFKAIIDAVYSFVPIAACFVSAYKGELHSMGAGLTLATIAVFFVFAILPWFALMRVLWGWLEVRR
jgi:hypothetical protein